MCTPFVLPLIGGRLREEAVSSALLVAQRKAEEGGAAAGQQHPGSRDNSSRRTTDERPRASVATEHAVGVVVAQALNRAAASSDQEFSLGADGSRLLLGAPVVRK